MNENKQDGDKCDCGEGILEFEKPENCSCHINPPCSACINVKLRCPICGFTEEDNE